METNKKKCTFCGKDLELNEALVCRGCIQEELRGDKHQRTLEEFNPDTVDASRNDSGNGDAP